VLLRSLVNLYKASGGGWVVEADKLASQPMGTQPAPSPGSEKKP